MIKAKNFTYVHPLKCGGTFVNKTLLDIINCKEVAYHLPRNRVSYETNFVTSVRNPFDWYVSFYYHSLRYRSYFIKSSGDFKSTLMDLLNLKQSSKYSELLSHDWLADYGPMFTTKDFEGYPDDMGFYSWYWNRMNANKDGNTDDVHVMRVENLREDLIATIDKFDGVSQYQKDVILNTPNARVEDKRTDYHDYYDDEMIAMVYKQDKAIFDKFGYEF